MGQEVVKKNRGTYFVNEATFFKPKMQMRVAPTSNVNLDEKKFNVDSGASVHMMSKMDMSPEELETVNVSRRPTTVITADGSINATEEATVYVKDLDMFVTVQLLKDTPAVLSLGKLCEENGFHTSGTKVKTPILSKITKCTLQMRQLRAHRRPWFIK